MMSADQEQASPSVALAPRQRRQFSLVPTTFSEAKEMASLIASSEFAPKDYRGKPDSVLIAVQMGADLGLSPMQALQNIAVINGRPSIWGDAALALVMPALAAFEEKAFGTQYEDSYGWECTAQRKGWPSKTVRRFTVHDAKVAKLWGKTGQSGGPTPWVTYPDRMLQMRARSFALRDCGADLLMGLVLAEEAGDYPEPIEVQGTSEPIQDPLEALEDEEQRAAIRKGFEACQMTPGQRTVKVNEYLANAANMTSSARASAAGKLLDWLKDEYSRQKTGQSRSAKKADNAKESKPKEQPATTSAPVPPTTSQPPAQTAPPPADKVVDPPVTDKDINWGATSAPLPQGEIF
jgi:hypothetical protein